MARFILYSIHNFFSSSFTATRTDGVAQVKLEIRVFGKTTNCWNEQKIWRQMRIDREHIHSHTHRHRRHRRRRRLRRQSKVHTHTRMYMLLVLHITHTSYTYTAAGTCQADGLTADTCCMYTTWPRTPTGSQFRYTYAHTGTLIPHTDAFARAAAIYTHYIYTSYFLNIASK